MKRYLLALGLAVLACPAFGQTVSYGPSSGGVPSPAVPGQCLIGSAGGLPIWGACSGSGTAVSSVTGTVGEITVSPTSGATVVSLPAIITSNKTFSGTVNFTGTLQIGGAAFTLPVPLTQGGTGATSAAAARTALGLGTAAVEAIGTSGAVLGLLNANKTFGGTNTFTIAPTITAFAGTGLKCVHTDNLGNLSLAAEDCGTGTGGGTGGITQLIGEVTTPSGTGTQTATITAGAVTNAKLANPGMTLGTTPMTLGVATTNVAGLTLTGPQLSGTVTGSPTFSGGVVFSNVPTVTALGGSGTRCLNVSNAGLIGIAPSDCVPSAGNVTGTALISNQLIVGQGGVAIGALGAVGTTSTLLHGNAAGLPSFGPVALGTEVSGTLPAANMLPLPNFQIYQGNASGQPVPATISNALDIAFGATQGALMERGTTSWVALPPSPSGLVLTSNGPGNNPSYQAPAASGITALTGAVIAGPGSGSQVASLAPSGVIAGSRTVTTVGAAQECWTFAATGLLTSAVPGACSVASQLLQGNGVQLQGDGVNLTGG